MRHWGALTQAKRMRVRYRENNRTAPAAERFCQAPSLMAAPRRSCSSFVGEVKGGWVMIGYYEMKLLNRV